MYYPPAWLGLRGDSESIQKEPHRAALQGQHFALPSEIFETYDLVVVGAGISGLTSAYRYHAHHPDDKVLIIDNHEDFGGHAIRNEFTVGDKTLITYGGSESFDDPKGSFSKDAMAVLTDLGVDYRKFEQYFQKDLYQKTWGLSRGVFFNRASFGQDKIVAFKPEVGRDRQKIMAAIAQFPLPESDKQRLIEIYTQPKNYLKKMGAC